jgi:hypothetical protein
MNSMNRPGSQIEGNLIKCILSQGKYQNAEISLIDQIKSILRVELHFVDLSVFKNNQTDKVLETARKLEQQYTSEWAQVSLFKDYLENNEEKKAINAMNMALASKIDTKIKHRILNEF